MSAADWLNYPSLVKYRLEWAYNFDFQLFAWAAGCVFVVLWFHKRSSVISALILLAGGFSWYYVMFQRTYIHHFAGQYSFMAICPIAGLIAGETINSAARALLLLKQRWIPTRHQGTRAYFLLALRSFLHIGGFVRPRPNFRPKSLNSLFHDQVIPRIRLRSTNAL